jgi:hypothetical protein
MAFKTISKQKIYYGLGALILIGAVVYLLRSMTPTSSAPAPTMGQTQSECKSGQLYDVDTQSCRPIEKFGNFQVEPSEDSTVGSNEVYQPLGTTDNYIGNQYPKDCFPKDQLSPADLLPSDCNSKWAQSVPNCQGELGDMNFLTAGYHIGINTVGQTLRNANRQLRSEPLNPQVPVSPWLQTTIEPDTNRRPLEIGGGCN